MGDIQFNRVVVRKLGGDTIYLMLGFEDGMSEQIVGMRVEYVPRRWRLLLKEHRLEFSNLIQATNESGLAGIRELKAAMDPNVAPISKLIYFERFQLPLEITPS